MPSGLARRRGVDEPRRAVLSARRGGDVETVPVDRQWHDPRLGGAQDVDGGAVARVFDPGDVAGVEQHAGREAQPLLRPGGHHQLLGAAAHAAGGREIFGDRLAQPRLALRVAIAPAQPRAARQCPGGEPLPGGDEAAVDLGMAEVERARRLRWRRGQPGQQKGLARHRPRRFGGGIAMGAIVDQGQRFRHKIAGAGARRDIALGGKLLEHCDDGAAGDAELAGQRAGRRQPRAGAKAPLGDRPAQRRRQLPRQWQGRAAVERRRPQGGAGRARP